MNVEEILKKSGLEGEAGTITVKKESFVATVESLVNNGAPLVFMYATDERKDKKAFVVHAVCSVRGSGFVTVKAELPENDLHYPSLTKTIMAAHWFERMMWDQFGIVADGHPDWRRLMHHENIPANTFPLRKDFAWNTKLEHANEPYPLGRVEGEGVYEIPVGPIHAGIIEPGHFRFHARGERILSLEGKLFFKHKGVEKLSERKTPEEALLLAERISGDMSVGHAIAFVEACESASETKITEKAKHLRTLWNELERLTAHIFDIGNISGMGTGFTFMAAQGFRMVEELRRTHKALTGDRFLKSAITLGGAKDIDSDWMRILLSSLQKFEKEFNEIANIAYSKDGLMERFETTGVLSESAARAYGARGIAARASNVDTDFRRDHPYAAYYKHKPIVRTKTNGDTRSRFTVRVREISESLRIIRDVIFSMPVGSSQVKFVARAGESLGWSESFRGAIIDFVRIGKDGTIDRFAFSDPSFCNWPLFGELGPGNIVPDFPLCNKSLNLSYSGTDG